MKMLLLSLMISIGLVLAADLPVDETAIHGGMPLGPVGSGLVGAGIFCA